MVTWPGPQHTHKFACLPQQPLPPATSLPPRSKSHSRFPYPRGFYDSRRGSARAEDARGTPTQSHISPSIQVYEENQSERARLGRFSPLTPRPRCRRQPRPLQRGRLRANTLRLPARLLRLPAKPLRPPARLLRRPKPAEALQRGPT